MARPDVSIVIVNWNGKQHLPACLESLRRQTFTGFEVLVVDNGSVDGSVELLKSDYPDIRLIELTENRGFAEGCNIGIAKAVGDFLVMLNNDTRAENDWLENLVKIAEQYPQAGMVGSRTCVWDEPDLIDTMGGKICRDGMSRDGYRGESMASLSPPEALPILYPSGCAALYRREMLEQVGGFAGHFFAYAEDTDLGLRGRWAGWEAFCATGALVHHRYSATGGSLSPFKVRLVERNHYWVALRCFPLDGLLLLPVFSMQRYLVQFWIVLRRSGTGAEYAAGPEKSRLVSATLKGVWEAVNGLPRALRSRSIIRQQRKRSPGEMRALIQRHRLSFRQLLDTHRS